MAIKPKYILNKTVKATKEFTDRDEFLVAFNRALNRENLEDNKVLVYYGVGGIGKSSLINKICMNIDRNVDYAILDVSEANNKIAENGLYSLRKSFSKKVRFPLFDLAYAVYWKKLNPNTVMNEKTFPYLEQGNIALDLISTLGDLPMVSIISSILTASDKISRAVKNYYLLAKNEVGLIEKMSISELEERLPYYWASDFNESVCKSKTKNVIFIDTYEAIWEKDRSEGSFIKNDEWIRNLAEGLPNVLFVICGREKLRWHEENIEWEEYIEQHLIGELSDIDAKKFLTSANINDEEIQNAIIDGSEGVPYYLDLAIDTYYSIKRDNKECLPKYFEGTPKEIFYRFINHLNTAEIETLKVLAVPRYFDFSLFSILVKEFNTGYHITGFYELCGFSFVTERDNGDIYEMHKLMKDSLIKYQNNNINIKINEFMVEYYNEKLLDIKNNGNIANIKAYIFEYYYHGVEAYGINGFINSIKSKIEFIQSFGQYNIIINILEDIFYKLNYSDISIENLKYLAIALVDSYLLVGKNKEAEQQIIKLIEYFNSCNNREYDKVEFLNRKITIDKELHGVCEAINTAEKLYEYLNDNEEQFALNLDFRNNKINLLIELGKLNVFVREIEKSKKYYEEANSICCEVLKTNDIYEKIGLLNERLGEIYSEYLFEFDNANIKYDLAIKNYKEALSKDNSNCTMMLNMGLAYKRIGENNFRVNDVEEAIKYCKKAITIYDKVILQSPEIIDSYVKKGFAYIDLLKVVVDDENYRFICEELFCKGVESFKSGLALSKYNRSILTGLNGAYRAYGIHNFNINNNEEAIKHLTIATEYGTKSVEFIKDHPYSYNSRAKSNTYLGDVYFSVGKISEARKAYENAINDYNNILKIIPNVDYAINKKLDLNKKLAIL